MSATEPLLRRMAEVAEQCPSCEALYLVGGAVRDRMAGARPEELRDLDFVVVGDGVALGRDLVAQCGGDLSCHDRFGTATWTGPLWSRPVDIVTARRESYPRAGSLPEVAPGSLDEDLRRRDFTVNSMAARVWPGDLWQLLDPLGGLADLRAALLRIHHPLSFVDDPTRLLRLARFAVRLSLELHEDTAAALAAALRDGVFATLSGDRMWAEWELLCGEPRPAAVVAWMHEQGLADALGLGAGHDALSALARFASDASKPAGPEPLAALAILLAGRDTGPCAQHFGLEGSHADRLALLAALPARLTEPLRLCSGDDQLEELLAGVDAAARRLLVLLAPETAASVQRYEQSVQSLPPLLRGEDLLAAGLAEGPDLGAALRRVRGAQLRGEVVSAEQGLQLLGLRSDDRA